MVYFCNYGQKGYTKVMEYIELCHPKGNLVYDIDNIHLVYDKIGLSHKLTLVKMKFILYRIKPKYNRKENV